MELFRAELHVHTVLSPCAEIEMIPPLIISEAIERGINLIAITDHNATANIEAVINAAKGTNVHVLPGMELQTREEVHILCLFDDLECAAKFQLEIDKKLPDIKNNPDFFGEQLIVDHNGDFIRKEERLLINSVQISLDTALKLVHQFNGLFIPAHINRKAFGLIENLGFIPPEANFDGLEISRHISIDEAILKYPEAQKYALFQNGDVHR